MDQGQLHMLIVPVCVYRTNRRKDRNMKKARGKKSIIRNIFLWTFEILVVILFAYVIVYFFGHSRTNIGQSMDVTLSGGDTVLLNVLSYQLGSPERGDVISFKPNGSTTGHSNIKRIIGLPGETIQIKDGMTCTEEEINEFCMALPRYKRPRRIIFADVPRNPTGKIEKPKLRKIYGAEGLVDSQNKS